MADRYLLESGAPDGYLLEDGTGVLLISDCYYDTVISDAPVAYWRLGETSGTNFADEIGSLDGTSFGSPTLNVAGALSGDSNKAVTFDGTTAKGIDVADNAALDLGNGPLSIEMWIKRSALNTDDTAVQKGTTAYGVGFQSATHFIQLSKTGDNVIAAATTAIADTTTWHHVVLTHSASGAGNTLIYVDGVEGHTDTNPSFVLGDTATSLTIGYEPGYTGFSGSIDEVALYNYVLSPTKVVQHYNAASVACAAAATNASAGHASGTGAANVAAGSVKPSGGVATSTGAANNAAPLVKPNAGLASATGAAYNATTTVRNSTGVATATGAAYLAGPKVSPNAGLASATGAAYNATTLLASNATAQVAAGTGAANNATTLVVVNGGVATATGQAYDATVSVAVATNAPAGVATATGAAYGPSVAVSTSTGVATATGAAYNITATTTDDAPAGTATATGAAYGPTATVSNSTGVATATGAALNAAPSLSVMPGGAAATGQAYDATVAVTGEAKSVAAGLASAIGTAHGATISTGMGGHAPKGGRGVSPWSSDPPEDDDELALILLIA